MMDAESSLKSFPLWLGHLAEQGTVIASWLLVFGVLPHFSETGGVSSSSFVFLASKSCNSDLSAIDCFCIFKEVFFLSTLIRGGGRRKTSFPQKYLPSDKAETSQLFLFTFVLRALASVSPSSPCEPSPPHFQEVDSINQVFLPWFSQGKVFFSKLRCHWHLQRLFF